MKILFVENQYKTYFFEPIAQILKDEGHNVIFVVQNHYFKPKGKFNTHVIPYPDRTEHTPFEDKDIDDIISSDRNINYFKCKSTSHFYYYNEIIKKFVYSTRPDIVFGECTLFHELLIAKYCKELNVKYLSPLPCRYPTGRFSFYMYDTAKPYKGSGDSLKDEDAIKIIDNIVNRKISPDYMKPPTNTKWQMLWNKIEKTMGFYLGDRYNTPRPLTKLKIEKRKNEVIKAWDLKALKSLEVEDNFKVLYPLQVQPEENIDIMGRKRRDQLQVIKEISENLPTGCVLYVKPNPKPKYEVDKHMLDFVLNTSNIRVINHSVSMTDIFQKLDLIVTVTGTIAIESLLSDKPVISLIKTINNTVKNCVYVENLKLLPDIIKSVKNGEFPTASLQEKIDFINLLNKTSYPGNISDVLSDKTCVEPNNIILIMKAIDDILQTTNKENGFCVDEVAANNIKAL